MHSEEWDKLFIELALSSPVCLLLPWFSLVLPLDTDNQNPSIYYYSQELLSSLTEDLVYTIQIPPPIFCSYFMYLFLILWVLNLVFSSSILTFLPIHINFLVYCPLRYLHSILHVCYHTQHIFWIVKLSPHITL